MARKWIYAISAMIILYLLFRYSENIPNTREILQSWFRKVWFPLTQNKEG